MEIPLAKYLLCSLQCNKMPKRKQNSSKPQQKVWSEKQLFLGKKKETKRVSMFTATFIWLWQLQEEKPHTQGDFLLVEQ